MDLTDKYASVEGHSNLVRDESSQAIINTDLKGYELFKKRKETLQKQKNEIHNLKHEVSEIKQLLTILIEKIDG